MEHIFQSLLGTQQPEEADYDDIGCSATQEQQLIHDRALGRGTITHYSYSNDEDDEGDVKTLRSNCHDLKSHNRSTASISNPSSSSAYILPLLPRPRTIVSKWSRGFVFLLLILMCASWKVQFVSANISEDLVVETTSGKIKGVTLKSATDK